MFAPSTYGDDELPGLVRDVCRHVDPVVPQRVTQDAFDAARTPAGHPDAPSAKRISARLGLPWSQVKQDAFRRNRDDDRRVGKQTGRPEQPWLGVDVCVFALRLAAARLPNERNDPSPSEYDEIAQQLADEDGKRFRHGGRLTLPTSGQIAWRFGGWNRALAAAGLGKRAVGTARPGMEIEQAIEVALELTGCLLPLPDLTRFFALHDASLQNVRRTGINYPEHVERVRERRIAEGKWTPPGYAPKEQRPRAAEPSVEIDGPTARKRRWTPEELQEWMLRFVRERRGRSQTRRDYLDWARQHAGAPWPSTFGGAPGVPRFKEARDEARRRLREA